MTPSGLANNSGMNSPTAVETYRQGLAAERGKAEEIQNFLAGEARKYEQDLSRTKPGDPAPEPRFSNWEFSRLELHAAKEADPVLKAKYEGLYRGALEQEHEGRSRTFLIEKDADKLLDPISADHLPAREDAPRLIPAPAPYADRQPDDHQYEMMFER